MDVYDLACLVSSFGLDSAHYFIYFFIYLFILYSASTLHFFALHRDNVYSKYYKNYNRLTAK